MKNKSYFFVILILFLKFTLILSLRDTTLTNITIELTKFLINNDNIPTKIVFAAFWPIEHQFLFAKHMQKQVLFQKSIELENIGNCNKNSISFFVDLNYVDSVDFFTKVCICFLIIINIILFKRN